MGDRDHVPPTPPGRSFRARDAVLLVAVVALVLVVLEGRSVRNWGEQMDPGIGKDVIEAVGGPVGWIADRLPLADATDDATDWIVQDDFGEEGGFEAPSEATDQEQGGIPPVSAESFDPIQLGEAGPKLELDTLLITGDSMVMPMDAEIAKRLVDEDVEVIRDAHVGTGISKPGPLDWGRLSTKQVADESPSAVVVFVGAGEGFPLPNANGDEVECCGTEHAALYAARVRRMMDTYRRRGAARVYWMRIPSPRDDDDAEIIRMVNEAIDVASVPWRAHVRVVDLGAIFTPDDRFRSAMEIDGRDEIVREPDGLHLTPKGAELAAEEVLEAIRRDFPDLGGE
jgi:hypothetical protein